VTPPANGGAACPPLSETETGPMPPLQPGDSPDGTHAASVTVNGQVWTIRPDDSATLRDGIWIGGGRAHDTLGQYAFCSGTVYVLGTDSRWYRWAETAWAAHGASDQCPAAATPPAPTRRQADSPDRTHATTVIVSGAIWTIRSSDSATLRDGVWMGGGRAHKTAGLYAVCRGVVHVIGTNSHWYRWTGSAWRNAGRTDPCTAPRAAGDSPDRTHATTISLSGFTWTLRAGDRATLRNGVHVGNGFGHATQGVYAVCGTKVHVLGRDLHWWVWTNTAWTRGGKSDPCPPRHSLSAHIH
jgi:hypothetical protein